MCGIPKRDVFDRNCVSVWKALDPNVRKSPKRDVFDRNCVSVWKALDPNVRKSRSLVPTSTIHEPALAPIRWRWIQRRKKKGEGEFGLLYATLLNAQNKN